MGQALLGPALVWLGNSGVVGGVSSTSVMVGVGSSPGHRTCLLLFSTFPLGQILGIWCLLWSGIET